MFIAFMNIRQIVCFNIQLNPMIAAVVLTDDYEYIRFTNGPFINAEYGNGNSVAIGLKLFSFMYWVGGGAQGASFVK